MVEVIAAVGRAMMTACFVSVGSIAYRGRQSRDDLVRNTTAIELLTTKNNNLSLQQSEWFYKEKELKELLTQEMKKKQKIYKQLEQSLKVNQVLKYEIEKIKEDKNELESIFNYFQKEYGL